MQRYARVIPLVKLKRELGYFDYAIPEGFAAVPGMVVTVPFRKRPASGVIVSITEEKPAGDFVIQTITADTRLRLSPWQVRLIQWISEYYMTSPATVAQLMVPEIPKRTAAEDIPELTAAQSTSFTDARTTLVTYTNTESRAPWLRELCATQLDAGKQVLIITPLHTDIETVCTELGGDLAPRIIKFLPSLAKVPYFKTWLRLALGEPRIVVGSRSALFAPCAAIGAIVVIDEESEHHKQEEPNPRYNVKEVAREIQKSTGCALFLLSISPSLLSLYRVHHKEYDYRELDQRAEPAEPSIIDQRDEYKGGNFTPISEKLREAMSVALANRKKVFLFLNRKGGGSSFTCTDCGWLAMCPSCALPYAFYPQRGLVCHHCERIEQIPVNCPKCHGAHLKARGQGTEKIEDEVRRFLPHARILKLDQDTPIDDSHNPLIQAAEIIIGTVYALPLMKWSSVGVVGVISADTLLHLPDFRAAERTFSLLYRLVALNPGTPVLIQTHAPESPIFSALRAMSVRNFYVRELEERKLLSYPPFSRLIRLICFHQDKVAGEKEAREVYERIHSITRSLGSLITVLPPSPLHVFQLRNHYRWQIVIKAPSAGSLDASFTRSLLSLPDHWVIDVDPETLV